MNNKGHIAHIATIDGERTDQTLAEHLRASAEYAGQALESIGLYNTGYFSALIHDMGKAKHEYSEYLEKSYLNKKVTKGSVNHTFAAVKYIIERYYEKAKTPYEILTCEIIETRIQLAFL